MRIAYFHYLFGESTALNHARQFAEAARELGHEVTVHAMNTTAAARPTDDRSQPKSRPRLISRVLHDPRELVRNVAYSRRELKLVRSLGPDVLVVRSQRLLLAELLACRSADLPLVLEINAPADEPNQYMEIPGLSTGIEGLKVRRAERIVVVSHTLRDHLVARHRADVEKFIVNPNGADCERFHPSIDATAVRSTLGIGDRFTVGFVGSFHPWHGMDLLKQIIVDPRLADAAFLLVGNGPGWNDFRSWVADKGLDDRVILVGRVPHEDVPKHVAAMDVTLLLDLAFYMSPLKLLEYMAAGRAVVAPEHPALMHILRHQHNGLLFRVGDRESAAATIARLANDPELRRAIAAQGRRTVEGSFTWRHNAQRVIDACEAAIHERRARHG